MIQDQSENNSERGKRQKLYLSGEGGADPVASYDTVFEDCDWLVVQEEVRALLRVGFIISLHFEITSVIFPVLPYSSLGPLSLSIYSYPLSLPLSPSSRSLSLNPSLSHPPSSLLASLSLSPARSLLSPALPLSLSHFLFTMLSYLTYFIGNEQRHNKVLKVL